MINPFKKTYTPHEQAMFEFLKKIPLFEPLSLKQLSQFLPYMHERKFEQNEVVFFRNDPSHAMYLIKKGEVSLNIDLDDEFEDLTVVTAGNVLGESCLLKDKKRLLSAFVSSETAEFYVIPQDNIFNIFEEHTRIKVKMLEALANTYHGYNEKLFKSYKASMGFFNLSQLYRH